MRQINKINDDATHNVRSLVGYLGYACAEKGLGSNTVASPLATVAYSLRTESGVGLDSHHSLIINALMGLKRSHAVMRSQKRVIRPVASSVLMDGTFGAWVGSRWPRAVAGLMYLILLFAGISRDVFGFRS